MQEVSHVGELQWSSAARSHPGRVRQVNEDAGLEQPKRGLWAVADGMGGHSLGEFASRVAVRCLLDLPDMDDLEQRVEAAKARLQDANRRLRAEAARRDVPMIGTTIVALLAAGSRCACVWAGDSRIYLFRAGRLRQLTRDHSQLEMARAQHALSSDETLDRPPANVITRAVGGDDTLELDDVQLDVFDGDVFLLCSDGLSGEVSELAIEQALLLGHCRVATETLVDLALERGGSDNITAVVVRAEDPSSPDRTAMRPALG
jgi:protein phosphatase